MAVDFAAQPTINGAQTLQMVSPTVASVVADVRNAGTGTVLNVLASDTVTGAQAAFVKSYAGSGTAHVHAFTSYLTGDGNAFSSAANLVSDNSAASCVQVSGKESGRGSIKVAHQNPGPLVSTDANASALSIDVQDGGVGGTAAQGIFIDSTTGGTTGALLNIRNNGNAILKLVTDSGFTQPQLVFKGGPMITAGSGSPAGVVAAPVGSLYLRSDGGAGTSLYVKESGTGTSGWVAK